MLFIILSKPEYELNSTIDFWVNISRTGLMRVLRMRLRLCGNRVYELGILKEIIKNFMRGY